MHIGHKLKKLSEHQLKLELELPRVSMLQLPVITSLRGVVIPSSPWILFSSVWLYRITAVIHTPAQQRSRYYQCYYFQSLLLPIILLPIFTNINTTGCPKKIKHKIQIFFQKYSVTKWYKITLTKCLCILGVNKNEV